VLIGPGWDRSVTLRFFLGSADGPLCAAHVERVIASNVELSPRRHRRGSSGGLGEAGAADQLAEQQSEGAARRGSVSRRLSLGGLGGRLGAALGVKASSAAAAAAAGSGSGSHHPPEEVQLPVSRRRNSRRAATRCVAAAVCLSAVSVGCAPAACTRPRWVAS
jgi:hypothetical protein